MPKDAYDLFYRACFIDDLASLEQLLQDETEARTLLLQNDCFGFCSTEGPQTVSFLLDRAYEVGGLELVRELLFANDTRHMNSSYGDDNLPMITMLLDQAERKGGAELVSELLLFDHSASLRAALKYGNHQTADLLCNTARRIGGLELLERMGNETFKAYFESQRMKDAMHHVADHFLLPLALQQSGLSPDEILEQFERKGKLKELRTWLRIHLQEILLTDHGMEIHSFNHLTTLERLMALCEAWHNHPIPDSILDRQADGMWRKLMEDSWHPPHKRSSKSVCELDSSLELRKESSHLNHCVGWGSYAQKCLDVGEEKQLVGRTHIFSIRDGHGIPSSTFEVRVWAADYRPHQKHVIARNANGEPLFCLEIVQHEAVKGHFPKPPEEDALILEAWLKAAASGQVPFAISSFKDHVKLGETTESAERRAQYPMIEQILGFELGSITEKLPLVASWFNTVLRYVDRRETTQTDPVTHGVCLGFLGVETHFYAVRGKGQIPEHGQAWNAALHDAQTNPTGDTARQFGEQVLAHIQQRFSGLIDQALRNAYMTRDSMTIW